MADTPDKPTSHSVATESRLAYTEVKGDNIDENLSITVQLPSSATVGEVIYPPLIVRFVKGHSSNAGQTFLVRPIGSAVPDEASVAAVQNADRDLSSGETIVGTRHVDVNKQDNQIDEEATAVQNGEANAEDGPNGEQPGGVRFDTRYRCFKAKISLLKDGNTIVPVSGVSGGGDTGREEIHFQPGDEQGESHARKRHVRTSGRASGETAAAEEATYCVFDAITLPSVGTWRVLVQCMDWLGNETGRLVSTEVVVSDDMMEVGADERKGSS